MARNTGKKSKATDFAVRPVDTVQQRAHARDKRLMIIYGVGSVLYVALFVAAFWGFYRFLFLTSFRTGFTKALSVELSYVNRQCPNDHFWLWTPAEGLVECPYCHRMV